MRRLPAHAGCPVAGLGFSPPTSSRSSLLGDFHHFTADGESAAPLACHRTHTRNIIQLLRSGGPAPPLVPKPSRHSLGRIEASKEILGRGMCAPPPNGVLSRICPGAQVSSRHTTSDERGQESRFWARLAASNPHPRARFDLVCPRRCTLSSLPRPIFCCRFDGGRRPLGLRQVGPRVKVPKLGLPMPQCHRHRPSLRLRATHAMFRLRRRPRQRAARRP